MFFGLRDNDAGPSANLQIHPEDKVASQNNNSREARNTYSELAIRHEGIDAGIIGLRSLKLKRCAELDGAARLRLNFCD